MTWCEIAEHHTGYKNPTTELLSNRSSEATEVLMNSENINKRDANETSLFSVIISVNYIDKMLNYSIQLFNI
jgi:hypothetical protein